MTNEFDLEKQIISTNREVTNIKTLGENIVGAPHPKITAADPNQATGTYSVSTADIINNLQTRINDLETLLRNLHLLQ